MKKGFGELIISWFLVGFFMFALFAINARADTIFSLANAKWFNYLFVFIFVMFFVGFAVSVGFVFGLQRSRGRVVEREDLIEDKPFRISLIETVDSGASYVTIDVDGNRRILKVYHKVPKGATHLRVAKTNLGPAIEFLEITPEVVKTIPTS